MASRYGLQIRAATPADAPGVAELMANAGCGLSVSAWAERIEALRREGGTILLALEWGPPSGVVVLNWFRTLYDDHPVGQISTLLVGPGERRRGIGRLLVKAAAQAARSAGCGSLHLLTPDDDATLRAFAHASGFNPSGTALTRPLRKGGYHE